VRYRNVRYAIVPDRKRFARSELVTSYPPEVDCTKPGLGPVSYFHEIESLLFKLPKDALPQKPQEDEFDCLHFTITTPTQPPPDGKKHPVLFYIPGGANMSHEPKPTIMCDHTRLVEASIEVGKPIVCVLVHYRVALFGFAQLPVSLGAAGGNNGLYDQRNGLEWVKRFISGFGGDPREVTAVGESAGAWAVDAHLQAKGSDGDPRLQYFKRAAMWSGGLNSLRPLPKDDCEEITQRCVESVGMTVDDLLTCSTEEVVRAMDGVRLPRLNGVEDGEFLETGTIFTKPGWVESIMIGDCRDEVGNPSQP
jgi:carboxylesterase type B